MWHPGSERPVYLTLPAQRSSLLAMFTILVQKQPLHLWYMRIQHLRIQTTSRHLCHISASIRRRTLRQRNDEVMELHSIGALLGHGLVREVRHNQLFRCSFSCIMHDTPGQYIECTCKHTIVKT